MGRYTNSKNKGEVILDTDHAFPLMTETQLKCLLVEVRLRLDKIQGVREKEGGASSE